MDQSQPTASPIVSPLARLYPEAELGYGAIIDDFAIVGLPLAPFQPGAPTPPPTRLGPNSRVRAHAVIYAGVLAGARLAVGHGALIRERCRLGDDVSIGSHAIMEHSVTAGHGVRLHSGAFVPELTILEDGAWVGPHAALTNMRFPLGRDSKLHYEPVILRQGAKVGANATICPGVEVGEMALVAAGSVVTRDVPPRVVVAGNPARVIKSIDDLRYPNDLLAPGPYAP